MESIKKWQCASKNRHVGILHPLEGGPNSFVGTYAYIHTKVQCLVVSQIRIRNDNLQQYDHHNRPGQMRHTASDWHSRFRIWCTVEQLQTRICTEVNYLALIQHTLLPEESRPFLCHSSSLREKSAISTGMPLLEEPLTAGIVTI